MHIERERERSSPNYQGASYGWIRAPPPYWNSGWPHVDLHTDTQILRADPSKSSGCMCSLLCNGPHHLHDTVADLFQHRVLTSEDREERFSEELVEIILKDLLPG